MPDRPEILENAPLRYAPENELGVVFLFAKLARNYQLRVEEIRPRFPDCIAYQKVGGREKKIRIEFEYRSSHFRTHGHPVRGCDWIVCWEHDWPDAPARLNIVELRSRFGLGQKAWIQPVIKGEQHYLKDSRQPWALSKRARRGDLCLMYRCTPAQYIADIYAVVGETWRGGAGWREGQAYFAEIRRVCKLPSPIFLNDMRSHKVLKTSSFIRRNMQGNLHVTEYWPYLYEMIVERNPTAKRKLARYAPGRL